MRILSSLEQSDPLWAMLRVMTALRRVRTIVFGEHKLNYLRAAGTQGVLVSQI